MKKTTRGDMLFWVAVVGLVIFRIVLQSWLPIYMPGNATVDDVLFVKYADNILNHEWLGTYDSYTLNKVPMFGIILALLKICHIPYAVGIALFYSAACMVFLFAISKLTDSKIIRFILFGYMLYAPVMMDFNVSQRVYRMSVIPGLILIIVSCYIVLFYSVRNDMKTTVGFSILASVVFSVFYFVREDSFWFLSFMLGATLLVVLSYIDSNKEKLIHIRTLMIAVCLLLPFVACMITGQAIKAKNYKTYNISETNDFKDTAYADMGKNILKIKPNEQIEYVWVPRETIERIYAISPTFAQLEPYLSERYKSMDGFGYGNMDGEIEKDFIIWAIRFAASDMGVYAQGAKYTDEFFAQISKDIEQAFDDGYFEERDAVVLSNLARPFNAKKDLGKCAKFFCKTTKDIITYSAYHAEYARPEGNEENIQAIADMAMTTPIYEQDADAKLMKKIAFVNVIIKVYQKTAIIAILFVGIMLAYELYDLILSIKKKRKTNILEFLMHLGIFAVMLVNVLMVSLNYFEAADRTIAVPLYLVGASILWQILVGLYITRIKLRS